MEILKIVLSLAVLLVVGNILRTEGASDIPDKLSQETHTDVYVPLEHFRQKRAALQEYHHYFIDIQINVSSITVVERLKALLNSASFPVRLEDNVNVIDADISTVCSPVGSSFQCQCEDEYSWSLDSCTTYGNCSAIADNACGCINAFPPDGSFCELHPVTTAQPTLVEYIIEVEVNVSDIGVVNQLKSLLDMARFPFQLNNMIKITGVNLTTVCATCGCFNAIPPDGPFCPPVTTPSSTLPTTQLRPVEYIVEVEVNVSDIAVVNRLKSLLDTARFPFQLNNLIKITNVNLTTVCSTCGCVSAHIPHDGSFCPPLISTPTSVPARTTPLSNESTTQEPSSTLQTTAFTTGELDTTPLTTAPMTPEPPTSAETRNTTLDTTPLTTAPITPAPPTSAETRNTTLGTTPLTTAPMTPVPPISAETPNTTLDTTPLTTAPMTPEPPTSAETRNTTLGTTPLTTAPMTPAPPTSAETRNTTLGTTALTTAPITPEPPTKTPTKIPATTTTTSTPMESIARFQLQMSFKITSETFETSLSDTSSQQYRRLETVIRVAIDQSFRTNSQGYIGVSDIRFSSGSVVTNYILRTNQVMSSAIQRANQALVETLRSQNYTVDPNSFTVAPLREDTFENLDLVFAGDSMTLHCDPHVKIDLVTWKVKGKSVTNASNKYKISSDTSSLTVTNLITTDSGIYECSVDRGIVDFIRSQEITVLPAPRVFLEKQVISSHCSDIVSLDCCGMARNFRLEWRDRQSEVTLGTSMEFSEGLNCITIERSCEIGEETQRLICIMTFREKTFTQEATVHFFADDVTFSCNDSTYGLGKEEDIAVIGCEGGLEGNIAARCEMGTWVFVNSSCLSPEIRELQLKSEVLDQEDIGDFVEELNNVTVTSIDEVVTSTTNIATIVDILNNVVNVLNGTVSSTVIENFLETVDILISEETEGTWDLLNEGETTNLTASDLLNSVEEIVQVIENTSLTITTSRIQLNKATFSDDFNITFNSTDEIIVLGSMPRFQTEITTVRFATLDIVLPPRNLTSSNNTINGAVILAYTNSTITNVTLTFKIRNTTLANPQCVFWNFTETAWDSSGCEVQTDGNETVTCVCDHLTSFSILMSPFIPEAIRIILDFITYIGVGISMGSLVLCLIIEGIVWSVVTRNNIAYMRHVSIVNIAVSLLIANIWFMIGAGISDIDQMTPVGPCSAATFFIHFFYLALFFWMLISGLLLFYYTVMVFSHMSKRTMMAISFTVGYGAPLIIAVITVAVTAPQNGYFRNDDACWLNWFETKALLAFVIPALTIVAINFLIMILVLYKLLRRGMRENQSDDRNALIVIARCVALLTPFFGLTWGFGIGTMVAPESVGLHIVFAILNSLQGLFVLMFGTLLDSRIRAALAGRFSFLRTSSNPTRSTSGGPPSSSGLGLFLRRTGAYHVSEVASSSQSTAASESFLNT